MEDKATVAWVLDVQAVDSSGEATFLRSYYLIDKNRATDLGRRLEGSRIEVKMKSIDTQISERLRKFFEDGESNA